MIVDEDGRLSSFQGQALSQAPSQRNLDIRNTEAGSNTSANMSPMSPRENGSTNTSIAPETILIDGREMVDVATFNRTMHHLGKRAFLDGYEEGRTTLRTNSVHTPSRDSRTSASTPSSAGTPSTGQTRRNRDGERNGDDDEESDVEPCLKGRKSRKATGKRAPNVVFLMVSASPLRSDDSS